MTRLTLIYLYGQIMMSLSSSVISLHFLSMDSEHASSRQPYRPCLPSPTIRLLWAFSFHGWGKVWTGKKQLRRLSTAAVLVPTHSHASANSTTYTDFPQNQSESEKTRENPQSAARLLNAICSTDFLPLPFMQSSTTESSSGTYYIWIRRRVFAEAVPGKQKVKFHHYDPVVSHPGAVGEDEKGGTCGTN